MGVYDQFDADEFGAGTCDCRLGTQLQSTRKRPRHAIKHDGPAAVAQQLAGACRYPVRRQFHRLPAARQVASDAHSRCIPPAHTCARDGLRKLGLKPGERVATLMWNHHAHLECCFGVPAAGGVMHTFYLHLSPDELGWIARDAQDRFLIVDDLLLPLYRQFAHRILLSK